MISFIGIDPGQSGGIAILGSDESVVCHKLDCTPFDQWDILYCSGGTFALLEEMAVFPNQHPGSLARLTKLFRAQGILIGLLTAAKVRFETVRPLKWQKALGCLTKGNKKISYRKAQELYPQVKVTLWNADALLLAEYAKRLWHERNGATS